MGNIKKDDLMEHIQELADLYYQNQVSKGSQKLQSLVQELTAVAPLLQPKEQQEYLVMLQGFMEAMELKDYVMMADILTFDILEAIYSYKI